MFKSLLSEPGRERHMSHPVLSFALHAGIVAFAIGGGSEVIPPGPEGNISIPNVIYDHDGRGTAPKVESGPAAPLSRPICECPVIIPGPLPVDLPVVGSEGPDVLLPDINGPGTPGLPVLASDSMGPVREADLSDAPVVVRFPEPAYPPALRAAGIEGVVQATYVVNQQGGVEPESVIIVSSDHPSMSAAVREALVGARFHPGKVRGTPVRSLVRQTIRFSLMSL